MNKLVLFLFISGPLLGILYKTLDYIGIIDKLIGQDKLEEAYIRLKTPTGYPEGWIYDDEQDKEHFEPLLLILEKNVSEKKIRDILDQGHRPSMITVAGMPIKIEGIPKYLPQEKRTYYSETHPILVSFLLKRNSKNQGKGSEACTLGELENWIKIRKKNLDFLIGGITLKGFLIKIDNRLKSIF